MLVNIQDSRMIQAFKGLSVNFYVLTHHHVSWNTLGSY